MTSPMHRLRVAGSLVAAGRIPAIRALGMGALAFAVSCADSRDITGPPALSRDASLVSAHQAPIAGDVVIMHRSTLVAEHDGVEKVNRNFTEKISGQIRVRGKDDSTVPGTTGAEFTAGTLPRPVMSLPARMETGMCSALPSWSRVEKLRTGGTATISGVGDAPAARLKIVAEDGTVLTVERTWVRTSRAWQLAKQTTTTPDRRFRDEVVYEHQSVSGEPVNGALPRVACADARGPGLASGRVSRAFYSPHVSSVASRLFPLSDGATAYSCGDAEDCFTQENAVYTADVALVATATIAAYACTAVAVIVPAACLAAGVAWAAAVANLALAQRALNRCLYALSLPKPVTLRNPGWASMISSLALGDVTSSASRLPGLQPELAADCGTGGGAGGGTIQCHSEEWEISYDGGATWNYLTTIQVCENVM